jgi:uncharacterized protein (TIGR00369 family)
MPWTPRDPAFESSVRASFARQAMMTTLGARIVHLAPGELDLAAPFASAFAQQNGYWHAGAIASLADSANGYAAYTLAPPASDILAVEFKINLLAPARGEQFLACGRVVRPGRTLIVCQAEVFADSSTAEASSSRTLIAIMSSTLIIRAAP